ncbi:MAG: LysR family transcriptional regulator [Proteobacteria bacterium]|nr:LysR family transcriptional regulator [Pseudomonadota bacterium]
MDINQLKYFAVVAQTGSLRKAAELLSLSPSSLSRGIALLEDNIGCSLFERVGRGIELNSDGRRLYTLSQRLLGEFDGLREAMSRGKEAEDTQFSIGSYEVFSTYFFGEFVSTILPIKNIRFLELSPGEIESAVLDRVVDCGLTYAPVPQPDLDFLKVGRFEMASFVRRDSFADRRVQDIPYVIPITPLSGSVAGFHSLDCWPNDRFMRTIKYECQLLESALELARRGVAALHCPRFIVDLHNRRMLSQYQLVELKMPHGIRAVQIDTYIVKLRTRSEDSTLKKVAKGLRTILR